MNDAGRKETLLLILSMCIYDYVTIQINPSMTPAFGARLNYTYVGKFQRDGRKNVHRFWLYSLIKIRKCLAINIEHTGIEREYKFYETYK